MQGSIVNKFRFFLFLLISSVVLVSCDGGSTDLPKSPDPDINPPKITLITPTPGSDVVARNDKITIEFNETISQEANTNNTNTVLITSYASNGILSNNVIDLTNSISVEDKTLVVTVTSPLLDFATKYQVEVKKVKDDANIEMEGRCIWEFATKNYTQSIVQSSYGECGDGNSPTDTTAPKVVDVTPSGAAISSNTNLVIVFDEAIDTSTLKSNITLSKVNINGVVQSPISPLPFDFSYNSAEHKVILTPNVSPALEFVTGYQISILTGIKDMAGNALASQVDKKFTTDQTPDTKKPSILNVTPSAGSTVASDVAIIITFSEPMNQKLFKQSTFEIKDSNNIVVKGNYTFPSASKAQFKPIKNLSLLHQYTITLSSTLTDTSGNALILGNNGITTFNTVNGTWATNPVKVATMQANRIFSGFFSVAMSKNGNSIIVWSDNDDFSPTTNNIYSNYRVSGDNWDAQQYKVIVNGQPNELASQDEVVIDDKGNALMTYSKAKLPLNTNTFNVFSTNYSNDTWSTPFQLDTTAEKTWLEDLIMSPNGNAVVVLRIEITPVAPTFSLYRYMSRTFIPQPVGSKLTGWQTIEKIGRSGTFNTFVANGQIEKQKLSISNTGTVTAIYAQSDNSILNLWSNTSPFQSNTPILVESLDTAGIDLRGYNNIQYTTTLNDNAIISFRYADNTFWANNYSTSAGWGTENQVSSIPLTATAILETLKFKNNNELIIFIDNGKLKSTLFTSVNGWEFPVTLSPVNNLTITAEYVDVSFNKENEIVTVAWLSNRTDTTSQYVAKRYSPVLGWQHESTIAANLSGVISAGGTILTTITDSNGLTHAFWFQKNLTTTKNEILSTVLQ